MLPSVSTSVPDVDVVGGGAADVVVKAVAVVVVVAVSIHAGASRAGVAGVRVACCVYHTFTAARGGPMSSGHEASTFQPPGKPRASSVDMRAGD